MDRPGIWAGCESPRAGSPSPRPARLWARALLQVLCEATLHKWGIARTPEARALPAEGGR